MNNSENHGEDYTDGFNVAVEDIFSEYSSNADYSESDK